VPVYALGGVEPEIDPTAYVHPDAVVIGHVRIGPDASVWPNAVLRGDDGLIDIGARTSVQDGTVVHVTSRLDTVIGERCVIGHAAHLEGCVIEDRCLVGSGSILLHEARLTTSSLAGANAVVPNAMVVPAGAMALGVPAVLREGVVTVGDFDEAADLYVERARRYREELRRLD
jgi:carbonic anhydrase/acetyltransferase-like protein (isoleucine patch superfamily)